jgi:hypothetical protein
MSKIVYICGDSHTAGGELVDHALWPDQHPGFWGLDETDLRDPKVMRRWREFRERKLRAGDPVGYKEWQHLERHNAWPEELYSLGNLHIENGAVIGQSMEWVARQTVTDVSKLLKQHQAADITAIIQPTTHVRLQRYDVQNRVWDSFQLGNAGDMDPRVHEWFVNNEDDESLLSRWMISVMGLCSLLNRLGVRVILINAGMPDMNAVLEHHKVLNSLRDDVSSAAISEIYQQLCGPLWHPRSMWDLAHSVEKPYCPDLHWRREVHQLLARDLLDSYHL